MDAKTLQEGPASLCVTAALPVKAGTRTPPRTFCSWPFALPRLPRHRACDSRCTFSLCYPSKSRLARPPHPAEYPSHTSWGPPAQALESPPPSSFQGTSALFTYCRCSRDLGRHSPWVRISHRVPAPDPRRRKSRRVTTSCSESRGAQPRMSTRAAETFIYYNLALTVA